MTATPASSSGGGSAAGNDGQDDLNSVLGSGLAVGAILCCSSSPPPSTCSWCEAQKAVGQKAGSSQKSDAAGKDYANHDLSAYPGGQSLPPWPYPEAKPTARPTPASYDPACILKVSWPRDAARPTEDTLRETFEALAPVLNVGLGSGNAAMVVFKDAAGARAAEAAYDGPWRTAPAKPPRPPLISRRRRRPRRARARLEVQRKFESAQAGRTYSPPRTVEAVAGHFVLRFASRAGPRAPISSDDDDSPRPRPARPRASKSSSPPSSATQPPHLQFGLEFCSKRSSAENAAQTLPKSK